jgi:hypothetical protein
MTGVLRVSENATAEEVAAVLAALSAGHALPPPDAYIRWKATRRRALRAGRDSRHPAFER